ncbi:MAG: DUF1583 domain-containing protein [Planctomycetaceae bacterium]|nr:DUF1583 domain-containing protein [Planctomycetaceae bacterium]
MRMRFLLAIFFTVAATSLSADDYTWDFRNGHFDNLSLVPIGSGAVNLLEPTAEGLRITAPAGYAVRTVGFSPRFRIRGDFEILVDFTILKWTQPEDGYGSGPTIYLSMGKTDDPAASIGRKIRTDGRDVFALFAARVEEGQRIPSAKLFDAPQQSRRTGRLQLKRTGHEITYSVADRKYASVRELATLPVSDADVTLTRIGVEQSDPQSFVAMILHNISIHADELPDLPSEQSRTAQLYRPRYLPPEEPKSNRWIWQTAVALLLTCGFGFWLWKRTN